jgi:hypothetical protein
MAGIQNGQKRPRGCPPPPGNIAEGGPRNLGLIPSTSARIEQLLPTLKLQTRHCTSRDDNGLLPGPRVTTAVVGRRWGEILGGKREALPSSSIAKKGYHELLGPVIR